jgi:hypothetical protein
MCLEDNSSAKLLPKSIKNLTRAKLFEQTCHLLVFTIEKLDHMFFPKLMILQIKN